MKFRVNQGVEFVEYECVDVPAIFINVEYKGESLFLKRANTIYMPGFWTFVAGHVSDKESTIKAARRELFEETSIDLDEKEFKIYAILRRLPQSYLAKHKYGARTDYFYKVSLDIMPKIKLDDKASVYKWSNVKSVKPLVPSIEILYDMALHRDFVEIYNL